jgi:hypothetical protein
MGMNPQKRHARHAIAKTKVSFTESDDDQEPAVRGAGGDTEGVADDQPADEPELRASTGADGAGQGAEPVDMEAVAPGPEREFHCEVCDKRVLLTDDAAYRAGWDYPPFIGQWGILSPRTCGDCGVEDTAWWQVITQAKTPPVNLSEKHLATVQRILAEQPPAT